MHRYMPYVSKYKQSYVKIYLFQRVLFALLDLQDNKSKQKLRLLKYKFSPYAPSLCLMTRGPSGEIEKILLHNICNEISLRFLLILHDIVVCALAFHGPVSIPRPGKSSNWLFLLLLLLLLLHQTFLIRLITFKITQILSPEKASERKGMPTIERFIWVNLCFLDLRKNGRTRW